MGQKSFTFIAGFNENDTFLDDMGLFPLFDTANLSPDAVSILQNFPQESFH